MANHSHYVEQYKYLGFPFTADGINLNVHIQNLTRTGRRQLATLQTYASHCHPGMRLHLYRTFTRPTFEYGLGLVQAWISYMGDDITSIQPLNELHKDGLRWIAAPSQHMRIGKTHEPT